jgi:hypothetical protein
VLAMRSIVRCERGGVEQFNGKEANQRLQAQHRENTESQHEDYRVMLLWNNDVTNKTEAVMEAIHDATAVTPPRLPVAGDPPPQGEGGK